jgi:hypothetical protein
MHRLLMSVSIVVGSLAFGCGSPQVDYGPLGTLKGKVTFKGEPFTQGTVILAGDKSGTGSAPLQQDGTFYVTDRIGGLRVGTYKIAFEAETKEVTDKPNTPPRLEAVFVLPKKYYSTETSGLSVEIKKGANTLEFDVTE